MSFFEVIVTSKQEQVFQFFRCTCGNCDVSELVTCREYRCCKEMLQAVGKFTFEGHVPACILTHGDYAALTHKAVLHVVGPFLTGKDGKKYRQKGRRENE